MLATFVFVAMLGGTMTPLEMMVRRNVVVETNESRCSGVILSTGIVLSVFHAIEIDSDIKVNGKEAKIVLIRPDLDMIVLRTTTDKLPDVVFGINIGIATPVISVGNPLNMDGLVSRGFILFKENKHIYLDIIAMPGFSGGGIYTENGELIGLAQKMRGAKSGGSWMAQALRSERIIEALEKLEKK